MLVLLETVYRKCQKFPPLDCDSEGKSSCTPGFFQSASSSSFDQMEKVSVPRQRFILMILVDMRVQYTWNRITICSYIQLNPVIATFKGY